MMRDLDLGVIGGAAAVLTFLGGVVAGSRLERAAHERLERALASPDVECYPASGAPDARANAAYTELYAAMRARGLLPPENPAP